jgi:uncharacterized repeat protein (TIGR03803 family)
MLKKFFVGPCCAVILLSVATPLCAQSYSLLHTFAPGAIQHLGLILTNSDGANSQGGLAFSGATLYGSAKNGGTTGSGTLFAVDTNGTGFRLLYTFSSDLAGNSDGANPNGALVLARGILYGTTFTGGDGDAGVIFSTGTNGLTIGNLHTFTATDPNTGINSDGANPSAGLVLSGATLFGTASAGGQSGSGALFSVGTNGGNFKVLHHFTVLDAATGTNLDGAFPSSRLTLAGATLFGTTAAGGAAGFGTVFAIGTNGTGFTVLHHFDTNGANPMAELVISGDTLYGIANSVVFSLATNGTGFTILHQFSNRVDVVSIATPGLTLTNNTLFGAASSDGAFGSGEVFSIDLSDNGFASLYDFTEESSSFPFTNSDGAFPNGGLMPLSGTLYGTTGGGGVGGNGVVFSLSATPPIDTTPPTVASTDPANNATGVPTNQIVHATFSEPMDPSTITTTTMTLQQGGTPLAGTVSYAGTTASFTPANALLPNTTYTATITTGAKDLAGNALANNFVWSFTTAAVVDNTPPTVSSTDPANNATGVPTNQTIQATFSEPMDSTTITTTTFTLQQGATSVAGTVSYAGTTASFTPTSALVPNTTYTATITTGAKDLAGNALANNFVWTFITAAVVDNTPPTVTSTDPINGATGVPTNQSIHATFSELMDSTTIKPATFTLKQGATPVPGSVTYALTTATFTPSSALASSTTYTATITTGAKDLAGNALVNDFTWNFTTAAVVDTTPPTVTSTDPINNATGVSTNQTIHATFSESMDPSTINSGTMTLHQGATPVAGSVTYAGTTATFAPSSALASSTTYTATITTGAKDLAGNALTNNFTWNFTTAAAGAQVPPQLSAQLSGNNFILSFQTVAGQSYTVEQNVDLGGTNWSGAGTNFIGDGAVFQFAIPATNTQRFFRVRTP